MEETVRKLVLSMRPVGKGRPRFRRMGEFVSTYTPKKTAEAEKLIRQSWAMAWGAKPPPNQIAFLSVKAVFKMPSSAPKKDRALFDSTPCYQHADCDNILKLVQDALEGVAYENDREVPEIVCMKRWELLADSLTIVVAYRGEIA